MLRKYLALPVLVTVAALTLYGQVGTVKSGAQIIPGATVTVTQEGKKTVTSTDENGRYEVSGLNPGAYSIEVAMFGFKAAQRKFESNTGPTPVDWTLDLQPRTATGARRGLVAGNGQPNQAATEIDTALRAAPAEGGGQTGEAGNESFLLNGSLSRGLQSGQADTTPQQGPDSQGRPGGPGAGGPGAGQPGFGGAPGGFGGQAAGGRGGFGGGGGGFGGRGGGGGGGFGGGPGGPGGRQGARRDPNGPGGPGQFFGNRNNRGRDGIHGGANFSLRNSALDARSFSLTGADTPKAAYAQSRFGFVVGGPLKIPKLLKGDSTFFFINYNGTRGRNPYYNSATVPTLLERSGNFSQSFTNTPVSIFDYKTGTPFANNVIPPSLLNDAALKLLPYIPLPNQAGSVQNYQIVSSVPQNNDNLNMRLNQNFTKKDRVALNVNLQNRSGNPEQLFGFRDETSGMGLNTDLSYTRNIGQRTISVLKFNFNRNRSDTVPFFANKADVAFQAGIRGTSPDPLNYGPPNLSFTNFGGLSDASPLSSRVQSADVSETVSVVKGQHSLSGGFDFRRSQVNNKTDQNGRGTFNFSGIKTSALDANGLPIAGTGYDFADYLLGLPQSSSVRFGTAATYFRGNTWSAYGQDDWRVRANLTINLGLRYEYYSPLSEKYGHIANLDVASGFTGVAVVLPGQPDPYSSSLPASLVRPDKHDFAPRVGIAWKPIPGKPTLVRASYAVYYNGSIYNQIASRLASQPPFAQTTTLNTSIDNVLTLQNGLATSPSGKLITNTFAVDPNYLIGYAQTWTGSVQHELPRAIVLELGYLGTKGTRLDIQRLPNRAAPGSPLTAEQRRLIGNAVGFTWESSDGNSIYHAMQLRVIRRFRRGVSLNAFYTFAKSIDNSSTFGGAGNTVAQDDKNLRAERGLSSFDQRHLLTLSSVFSSPQTKSRLWQNWTMTGGLNAASGTPFTARVLGNLSDSSGTGAVGSGRADATGLPVSGGEFFNLSAFTIPTGGRFGDAGRNTITGPSQFTLNASIGRYFPLGERRRVEFRIDATNIANHVNYTNLSTIVNASNYGLPSAAGAMRTIQASLRLRF